MYKPVIILVNPQMPENIGMSARAMYNCGIENLRLVKPREHYPSSRAMATSADCLKQMPEVEVFSTVAEATADLQYIYASTARPRQMQVEVLNPMQAGVKMAEQSQSDVKVGILFGCEASGLANSDIAQCNSVVTAPLNPNFTSLNISQAVLLLSWNWWINLNNENFPMPSIAPDYELAKGVDKQQFVKRLISEIEPRGFFKSKDATDTVKRNIYNLFSRIDLNEQELKMLQGILSTLIKY
ncbi:MAG: TrmH family RNA methyltransferase [Alphaproteobacteria bacterium]|nr:TrmH family RNA methyltransferase [Alphaproteobacteria bacterium]